MKVGVLSVVLGDMPLVQALDYLKGIGAEAVEIGTGNYPGDAHCPVDKLLGNRTACNEFKAKIEDRGLSISALSCHGNPLHPNKALARKHHGAWRKRCSSPKSSESRLL